MDQLAEQPDDGSIPSDLTDKDRILAWDQIKAGVYLIHWSRLARFDMQALKFSAHDHGQYFESEEHGHQQIAPNFGRLICWIAFSVGGEYLSKGVCILEGNLRPTRKDVIRAPNWDENLGDWINLVVTKSKKIMEDDIELKFGDDASIKSISALGPSEKHRVFAATKFLSSTIRNRDAHRYARSERARHFRAVPCLFVRAFNDLLCCLDEDALREHVNSLKFPANL